MIYFTMALKAILNILPIRRALRPFALYHAGDSILRRDGRPGARGGRPGGIDVALLPINGRVPERRVAGNLWGDEAAAVAHDVGARVAVPMHFEQFAFNTEPPDVFVGGLHPARPAAPRAAGGRAADGRSAVGRSRRGERSQREGHAHLGAALLEGGDREGVRHVGDQREAEPGARAVHPRPHAAALVAHGDPQQVEVPLDRDREVAGVRGLAVAVHDHVAHGLGDGQAHGVLDRRFCARPKGRNRGGPPR